MGKPGTVEGGTSQVGTVKPGAVEVRLTEPSVSKVSRVELTFGEVGSFEVDASKVRIGQVGASQVQPPQVDGCVTIVLCVPTSTQRPECCLHIRERFVRTVRFFAPAWRVHPGGIIAAVISATRSSRADKIDKHLHDIGTEFRGFMHDVFERVDTTNANVQLTGTKSFESVSEPVGNLPSMAQTVVSSSVQQTRYDNHPATQRDYHDTGVVDGLLPISRSTLCIGKNLSGDQSRPKPNGEDEADENTDDAESRSGRRPGPE